MISDSSRCPCLSGEAYGGCCGPSHRGEADAPTAERLMRSRFSAYAVGDAAYVLRTWHPSTRPASLDLDPGLRWYRLDIVGASRGGLLDQDGTVEFRARYRHPDGAGEQHELSRFRRVDGRWVYVDAVG